MCKEIPSWSRSGLPNGTVRGGFLRHLWLVKFQVPELSCQFAVPTVGHVIPRILPWDMNDEEALKLSAHELQMFGGTDMDFSKYLLNEKGTAPCALHAWGKPADCMPVVDVANVAYICSPAGRKRSLWTFSSQCERYQWGMFHSAHPPLRSNGFEWNGPHVWILVWIPG